MLHSVVPTPFSDLERLLGAVEMKKLQRKKEKGRKLMNKIWAGCLAMLGTVLKKFIAYAIGVLFDDFDLSASESDLPVEPDSVNAKVKKDN